MKTSILRFTASLCTALLLFAGSVNAQEFAVLLNEDFEGGALPAGWSLDQAAGSDGWQFNIASYSDFWEIPVHPDGGVFTASNDDLCNCDMSNDMLFSPVMNLTPYDSATLIFDYFYNAEYGSTAELWFSYDGGVTWLFVPLTAADDVWQLNVGLTLANGADLLNNGTPWYFTDQMVFAFRHDDEGGWADGVAVDNVALVGFSSPCDNVLPISCAAPTTLSLQGAGIIDWQHTGFCDAFSVNGFQQLYTFTPDVTDEFTLTVSDVTSGSASPWFQYYVKEVSAGCDIAAWACIGSFGAAGSATFSLEEGVDYYILVASEVFDPVSQTFEITCPAAVPGCNDPSALNYDATANQNDGSCVIPTCGDAPLNVTHCYGNNADDQFLYGALNPGDMPAIVINSGVTESGWDFLTIYDGDNTGAPVLYTGSGDHSGVMVQSTSGSLLVVIESDGSVSCESGSACCASGLDWDVYCGQLVIEGCTDPLAANYDPAATVDDGSCVVPTCGDAPLNVTHCYGNNADDQFVYVALNPGDMPVIVVNSGSLESCCDDFTIYDGLNTSAPVLFTGGGDVGGVIAVSTSGFLLVQITSDGSVSCESGSSCCATGLDWDVYCGQVAVDDCNGDFGGTAFIDGCGICAGGNTGITPGNSVTLDMTDALSDGWNGAVYEIYDNTDPLNPVYVIGGNLETAQSGDGVGVGQDILCLPDGCYLFTVGGGSWDDEIGWTLTGVDGGPLTGGAPESVPFTINTVSCPVAGCTDPESLNYDPAATVDDGSCIYPPANDDCADAITIDCSDSGLTGTTINSTVDADYTNCGAGGDNTTQRGVWYKVIGDNQQYTITTCDASGTGYDTRLTVFSGSCGSFTCVTGNDDMSPSCGTGSFRSEVTFNANAGTDYYVYVHGFQNNPNPSAVGNFILNISCTELCLPVPSNDDCASASSLSVSGTCSPVTGTTQCATAASSNPACFSQFATLADVWYSFVAPADGEATMNITNVSAVGTGYTVYDACGGTEVDCDAAYVSGTDVAWTGLTAGATYYIQVMTNGVVNAGDFTICITGNVPDCNGDLGGSAFLDDCNECVGGNTGLTACVQDCNGDFGGTAVLDDCNVCVGGNTGLTACVQDCNGDFGGTAVLDDCNVCVGGNTGLTACVQDCNGDFGGTAVLDDCNVCVGGNTGLTACVQDCNGDFGGTAVLDNCNVCVGGNTGLTACVADCNGDFGGTAFIDECDDCVGGNTGLIACIPIGVAEGGLDRNLSVYPNPNNGQFIVELNGAEGVGTLNIMDMMGRRVYTAGVNFNGSFRQSIDLNVAKGTYVLQVITESGIATRKVELH